MAIYDATATGALSQVGKLYDASATGALSEIGKAYDATATGVLTEVFGGTAPPVPPEPPVGQVILLPGYFDWDNGEIADQSGCDTVITSEGLEVSTFDPSGSYFSLYFYGLDDSFLHINCLVPSSAMMWADFYINNTATTGTSWTDASNYMDTAASLRRTGDLRIDFAFNLQDTYIIRYIVCNADNG